MSSQELNAIYKKISSVVPEIEWKFHAPIIEKINKLKNKLRRRLLPISSSEELNIGDEITFNNIKIGKILINQPYPFGLIKVFEPNLEDFKDEILLANNKECEILENVK